MITMWLTLFCKVGGGVGVGVGAGVGVGVGEGAGVGPAEGVGVGVAPGPGVAWGSDKAELKPPQPARLMSSTQHETTVTIDRRARIRLHPEIFLSSGIVRPELQDDCSDVVLWPRVGCSRPSWRDI